MAVVCMIHPVHIVRHPSGVRFDAYYFQLRMSLENSAENESADDVLASADDRQEAVELGPAGLKVVTGAGQDVKAERHLEIDRGLIERRIDRTVVILERGVTRHHDALEPELFHLAQIRDSFLDRAHRRLPGSYQSIRMRGAVLAYPQVVSVEACLLVVEVAMVAEDHADGGIDNLGGDAVAILVGHPRVGIPSALMHLLELRAECSQLARVLARGRRQRDVDRTREVLDDEHVAQLLVVNHVRHRILILVIDSIDVSVGRLGDMRVGGDNWLLHRMPSIGFASARDPDRVFSMMAAELSNTRALRALQRRGYIPIGQDREEARAILQ